MADSALQRKNMVESQVRPSDVTDRRITAAMQQIARERFVPQGSETLAYMDEALAVGQNRAMMAPRTFARLLQLASVESTDTVLDVGCLTGYSAAIVSGMAKSVVALESDTQMAAAARRNLADLKVGNVEVVSGELAAGYAAKAPYEVILLEGAIDDVPEALLAQLAQNGRLVAIETKGRLGSAIVVTKSALAASKRTAFEASAPRLPGFAQPAGFVF
ncbi:MAG: protein-L-isoaspartate O-methyltransferase [Hyphomicrobium sp.]